MLCHALRIYSIGLCNRFHHCVRYKGNVPLFRDRLFHKRAKLPKPVSVHIYLCKHLTSPYSSVKNNPLISQSDEKSTCRNSEVQWTMMENLVNKAPSGLKPYLRLMRIDKPTGTWLLLWPCYWSLAMAATPGCLPSLTLLTLFGFGAVLMRGAGCTINDLWDKDIDSKVSRTKHRPLVTGEVTVLDAWMLLGGQLSLALLVLLQLNWYSILLGSSSLALVTGYPLVKRISHWPQLMLGLTFNWGALLGFSAVHGMCQWTTVLPLYAACVSWTMIYDTIYAHQDKVDDVLIKIKSTAIQFGDKTKYWLSGFSASMVACLFTSGYVTQQTWPFYGSVAVTGALLLSQVAVLDINDPRNCWKTFKANQRIGWIVFFGIVAGTLVKETKESNLKKSNLLNKDLLLSSSDISLNKVLSC